jgi:tetratricopeptide (TPR) repeat protein
MAQPSTPVSIQLGRFKRLPRRSAHTWQGGIVRMPMWIDSPSGGNPFRPWGAVWVTKPDGLVGTELAQSSETPGADLAVTALIELALRYQDRLMGRPGRLEVVDAELGAAVVAALGDPAVAVDVVPELTEVRHVLRALAEHQQAGTPIPDLLSAAGVTVEDVRQFAAAAERFYRAEPWQHLTNDDPMTVDLPGLDKRARCATVMGNAGLQYGIAFHASQKDADAMYGGRGVLDVRKAYWSITFSRADEMPITDLELWEDYRLPLAGDEAYPVPMGYGPGDVFSRPSRKLLRNFTAVLAALAHSSEQEFDTGRWAKHVEAGTDQAEVTLTLPHVWQVGDSSPSRAPSRHDRRANERLQAEIGRFLEGKDFATLDEANAAVQERFSGRTIDDIERTASTPLERAQDLVYEAFEAVGRRRVILARQAMAISPDCADAYVILAEAAAGPVRALPFYEQGVAAGERALGVARFEQDAGHFWGIIETRPYMRARLGLAQTLVELGRVEEALAHFRELLRLNPGDNQGVRDLLLGELVRARRDDEALKLLQEYKDDFAANWAYTWALVDFRNGRRAEAEAAAARAFEVNAYVPDVLVADPDDLPPTGDSVMCGGPDEAIAYVEHVGDVWHETPGAVEWLRREATKHGRGARGARGSRSGGRPSRRRR